MRRPYVVYQEGNTAISNCDPVPMWFTRECVHKGFCQCHLVGPRHQGWHHPDALCSHVVSRRHQSFEKRCGSSQVGWQFPIDCNENIKDIEIATKLARIVMHVLLDVPPPVPPRGEPLVSILSSRERQPKLERVRLRDLRRRRAGRMRSRGGSGEFSEEDSEGGGEESSEEESVA